ncbi:MAG: biopolymer transporter ExbD [Candidatus Nephrothrix sp. EaCA]|nr:MAG: biopolymer transporter ExbD [Candidatus Nephrothrix sp. EaCA]
MKIKLKKQFHAEVATASLNDIMFFLLLFFLIISTVANPNVLKILLPQSKASQMLSKQLINLTVTDDKKYFINNKPVSPDELETSLLNACSGNGPEPTIVLHIPRGRTIQDLVDVLQIGVQHKIKIVLATDKK